MAGVRGHFPHLKRLLQQILYYCLSGLLYPTFTLSDNDFIVEVLDPDCLVCFVPVVKGSPGPVGLCGLASNSGLYPRRCCSEDCLEHATEVQGAGAVSCGGFDPQFGWPGAICLDRFVLEGSLVLQRYYVGV